MPPKLVELWRKLCWWAIYLGPRRDVTIQTTNGLLTVHNKDWLVGKYLCVRRSHEEHEIRSAVELLGREGYLNGPRGRAVLNVGANIGMTCIGLLKGGYFERAIAFEPAPENYRLLVQNIAQNALKDQIEAFPFALSSLDGDVDLELSNDNSGDHRIRKTGLPGFFREEKRRVARVPAKTFDQVLVESPNLANEAVDLVWVDIQGHEGHFLAGARRFLSRGIPVVSEFWPYGIERSGISPPEFCRILSELFTHLYVLAGEPSRKQPIANIMRLFDVYRAPREMCLIALVRDPQQTIGALRRG